MKMTIAWHEECLHNRFQTCHRLENEAARAKALADKCRAECEFYVKQISRAKAEGKDGFDRERFMKPRSVK